MRELANEVERATKVICKDEAGEGGAHHKYDVISVEDPKKVFTKINFQNGPIGEKGPNGCQNEDLLSIVMDRLRCFQSGPYPCRENALALMQVEKALRHLNDRTRDRQRRDVEGKNEG